MLIVSCQSKTDKSRNISTSTPIIIKTHESFDWLLGKWKRNNDKPGNKTFENWTKISNTEYVGTGFTMQANDTIQKEQMRLVKKNTWVLQVKTSEEKNVTSFKIIMFSNDKFSCENLNNDFPNTITYWKNGDKLNASIKGGTLEIGFEFEKLSR